MKPLVFRLRPDATPSLFARVLVFPTREAMYDYRPIERDHLGSCTPIERVFIYPDGRSRRHPMFAEVCLFREACGSTVVTHEIFHAAMAWARRTKLDAAPIFESGVYDEEETLAHVHSDMVGQLVNRLWDAGILD